MITSQDFFTGFKAILKERERDAIDKYHKDFTRRHHFCAHGTDHSEKRKDY